MFKFLAGFNVQMSTLFGYQLVILIFAGAGRRFISRA